MGYTVVKYGSGMSLYSVGGRFLAGTSGAYVSTPRLSACSATFRPPPSDPSPEPRAILVECRFSRNRSAPKAGMGHSRNIGPLARSNTGLCSSIGCGSANLGVEPVPINDDEKRSTPLFEASLLSAAIALGPNPVVVKYAAGDVPPLPFAALRFTWRDSWCWGVLALLESGNGLKRKLGSRERRGEGDGLLRTRRGHLRILSLAVGISRTGANRVLV
jgi:hypothetical protein